MTSAPATPIRAPAKREPLEGCSLTEFSSARRLTITFLSRELAWADASWHGTPAIEIPYVDRRGSVVATRYRVAIAAKDRFRWATGTKPCAYEPDRGKLAAEQRYTIIVEGESDTATLLANNFPALGIPGSGQAQTLESHHIHGLEMVFVVREPGLPGELFVAGITERARMLGFEGSIHELRMPNGNKDPSALYLANPDAFAESLCKALESARTPPRPAYLTLAEMAATALVPIGQRLTTGFKTLDDATRGGVPFGRVVVVAGAPGAAKTGLSTYLVDRWERAGAACVYLAADEPAEAICTRFGQLSGHSRDALESGGAVGDAIRADFAAKCADRAIAVIDPDADETMMTIEDAERALLHFAGNRPRVLVIDSLQTARCTGALLAESLRERIDAKIAVIKAIAKRGTMVVAISEMARSGYRSGSPSENTSALAAAKESGSIEYGCALLLGLRSVKGESGLIDIEVAKNRLGGNKPELRLQLDFERASFEEVERTDSSQSEVAAKAARFAKLRSEILAAARSHSLTSANEVYQVVKGTKAAVLAEVKDLKAKGILVEVNGVIRVAVESSK